MSSPIVKQILQIWDDAQQEKYNRQRQKASDIRQQVEDERRRQREDEAAAATKFLQDLMVSKIQAEEAGAIEAGKSTSVQPGQVPSSLPEAIQKVLSLPTSPDSAIPPVQLGQAPPSIPEVLQKVLSLPTSPDEAPEPPPMLSRSYTPEGVKLLFPETTAPTESPQASISPVPLEPPTIQPSVVPPASPLQLEQPKRIMLTLPNGKIIPLSTVKEKQAEELKYIRAKTDATADLMDVPNDPRLFGDLAGQKGVRTSIVNTVINALGRQDIAEAKALLKSQEEATKKKEIEEEARVTAQAWGAGQTYPTTQKATSSALKYMDDHPEEFPRRPKKLGALQQKEVEGATYTLATIEDVKEAYEKVKNKVGPWKYQLKEFLLGIPGKADPDFVTFNTMLRGMNNLEIKRITGAQMSEAEAGRLLKGMATGNLKQEEFEAALRVMARNAKVNREIVLFGSIHPDLTQPIATTWEPVVTAPNRPGAPAVDKAALLKKYGYLPKQ